MTLAEKVCDFLRESQNFFGNPQFTPIVELCLRDLTVSRVPASTSHHHCYDFGTLVHTAEVVNACIEVERLLSATAHRNLITAAILHDWGKVRDYRNVLRIWINADFRDKIRHVAESYARFRAVQPPGVALEDGDQIGHMILSHHGRKEWGSPVEPQTPEAHLLHSFDMWSAAYGPNKDAPVDW